MKLIDKDALVAEIRKRLLPVNRDKHYDEWEEGQDSERIAILGIIDTLEVKKVDMETFDKRVTEMWGKCVDNPNDTITYLHIDSFIEIARHFFELGLKTKGE